MKKVFLSFVITSVMFGMFNFVAINNTNVYAEDPTTTPVTLGENGGTDSGEVLGTSTETPTDTTSTNTPTKTEEKDDDKETSGTKIVMIVCGVSLLLILLLVLIAYFFSKRKEDK